MRLTPLCLSLGLGLTLAACAKDPPPSQYPQQPGYNQQQPYPQQQQPYQQQPQQQQQYPAPTPAQPTPAAPAAGDGQPTAIPGVLKNANGTCSITPPSFTGQPAAPLVGPCPPGL